MHNKLVIIFLLPFVVECRVKVPTVTFNNGKEIPILGLGTYDSKPNEVGQAVEDAIDSGYRHIDCAYYYQNEKEIGQAISKKIAGGVVKRQDLFITSKLWMAHMSPDKVEYGFNASLAALGLQYLDLYLIHWPTGIKESGLEFSDDDYVDTWLAMEKIYKKGLAKSIGISNFNKKQIERLLEKATVVPVTNQVECHPYLNQEKLIKFCKSKNIAITGYSPLGSATEIGKAQKLLENSTIKRIARKIGKTPAQIVLRYQIQRNVIVIPKSIHKNRIVENIQIFDFELSADDMRAIDSLDIHGRTTQILPLVNHKHYPFADEY